MTSVKSFIYHTKKLTITCVTSDLVITVDELSELMGQYATAVRQGKLAAG